MLSHLKEYDSLNTILILLLLQMLNNVFVAGDGNSYKPKLQ